LKSSKKDALRCKLCLNICSAYVETTHFWGEPWLSKIIPGDNYLFGGLL